MTEQQSRERGVLLEPIKFTPSMCFRFGDAFESCYVILEGKMVTFPWFGGNFEC